MSQKSSLRKLEPGNHEDVVSFSSMVALTPKSRAGVSRKLALRKLTFVASAFVLAMVQTATGRTYSFSFLPMHIFDKGS